MDKATDATEKSPLLPSKSEKGEQKEEDSGLLHVNLGEMKSHCRRRDAPLDPLDVSEPPTTTTTAEFAAISLQDLVGASELRFLWILFQVVWPGLYLILHTSPGAEFILWVLPSSLFVFGVLSLVELKGKNMYRDECRIYDISPTVFWCIFALPLSGDARMVSEVFCAVVLSGMIVLVVLGILLSFIMCYRYGLRQGTSATCSFCSYYLVTVPTRGCPNLFQHLEERDAEQRQELEASQEEALEKQVNALSYLEDIARKRSRNNTKMPPWVAAVMVLVCVILYHLASGQTLAVDPQAEPKTPRSYAYGGPYSNNGLKNIRGHSTNRP